MITGSTFTCQVSPRCRMARAAQIVPSMRVSSHKRQAAVLLKFRYDT